MPKRLAGIAILLIGTLTLSSCAVGFRAQTNQQKSSGNGRFTDSGEMKIRGLSIVFDPANSQVGALVVTVHNAGDVSDSLIGVYESDGNDGLAVESNPNQLKRPIAIGAGETVSIGYNSDLVVPFVPFGNLTAGTSIPITLVFDKAPIATVKHVLVNENKGDFADVNVPVVQN